MARSRVTGVVLAPIQESGRKQVSGSTFNANTYKDFPKVMEAFLSELLSSLQSKNMTKRQNNQVKLALRKAILGFYSTYSEGLNPYHTPASQFTSYANSLEDLTVLKNDDEANAFVSFHRKTLRNLHDEVIAIADNLVAYDDFTFMPSMNTAQLEDVVYGATSASKLIEIADLDAMLKANGVTMSKTALNAIAVPGTKKGKTAISPKFLSSMSELAKQLTYDDKFKRSLTFNEILVDYTSGAAGAQPAFTPDFEPDFAMRGRQFAPFPVTGGLPSAFSIKYGWIALENGNINTNDVLSGRNFERDEVLAAEFDKSIIEQVNLVTENGDLASIPEMMAKYGTVELTPFGYIAANMVRAFAIADYSPQLRAGICEDSVCLPCAFTPLRPLIRGVMSCYYRNIEHDLQFEFFDLLLNWAKTSKQEKLVDFANKIDQAVINDVAKLNRSVTSLIEVNNAAELRKAQEAFFSKATVFEGVTYHPHETTEFMHRSHHEQIRKDGIIQLESSNHVAQLRVIKSRPDFSAEGILLMDANTGRVDSSCSANKVAPLMKELYERTQLGDSTITFDLSQKSLETTISELSRDWCFDFRSVGDVNMKLTTILPNVMLKPDHDIELVSLNHTETTRVTPASTAPMTTKITTLNTPNDVLTFGSMTSFFSSKEVVEYREAMTEMLANVYARSITEKVGTFTREISVAGDYNNTKFSKRLAQFDDKFQQFELSNEVKTLLVNPLTVFDFKEIFDPKIIQDAFSINGTRKVMLFSAPCLLNWS
jgi:hypothetical protein